MSAIKKTIIDTNGMHWAWDGTRIFCVEAEEEMIRNGENPRQNGYPADTWALALEVLVEGNYLETGEDE